jgi:hypothetical protein
MAEDNIVQKIKRRKSMSKRPTGRPKTRCEDDVLEDIKSINIGNWIICFCIPVVLRIQIGKENYLESSTTIYC